METFNFICYILLFSKWSSAEMFGSGSSTEKAYQQPNRTRHSGEATPNPWDISYNSPMGFSSTVDSHEAMNNRKLTTVKLREKRSFEFLMGLINNNSKYEVVQKDTDNVAVETSQLDENNNVEKKEIKTNKNTEATELLVDLMAKIVTYPESWQRIHQILNNLDNDLTNSQQFLKRHNLIENPRPSSNNKFKKQSFASSTTIRISKEQQTTPPNKWPNFDFDDSSNAPTTVPHNEKKSVTQSKKKSNGKQSYHQTHFTYHQVTGKPTHFKKEPIAYIAVSVISPRPSSSEEDYILETELQQLKPWKNKNFRKNIQTL